MKVCKICGSDDVDRFITAWYNVNTDAMTAVVDQDDVYWCNACDEETGIKEQENNDGCDTSNETQQTEA